MTERCAKWGLSGVAGAPTRNLRPDECAKDEKDGKDQKERKDIGRIGRIGRMGRMGRKGPKGRLRKQAVILSCRVGWDTRKPSYYALP